MANIHESIVSVIGDTPLVELRNLCRSAGSLGRVVAKLERSNPAGSVKDRAALSIIRAAEASGALSPGGTIIEATSGNTGVGLAALSAVLGYEAVIVMPDSMSIERRQLMQAYGARLILTPGAEGMRGAIARANEFQAETPGSIIAGQFENPANPQAHYSTTGPELWRDTDGKLSALVCGVGTGGTISGAGKFLKEKNPAVRIVAVEPEASAVLSGEAPSPHRIQGIGAGFIPRVLNMSLVDEIQRVADAEALETARALAKTEGLLVGISSGAAALAALRISRRPEFEDKLIAVILPDTGERYLSLL